MNRIDNHYSHHIRVKKNDQKTALEKRVLVKKEQYIDRRKIDIIASKPSQAIIDILNLLTKFTIFYCSLCKSMYSLNPKFTLSALTWL